MKAWSRITVMIWCCLITLKIQKRSYSATSMNTIPLQHHHCQLLPLFRHCPWMGHLRNPSPLDITKKWSTLPMNWKSTLNFPPKISTLTTQFSGGWAVKVNIHASFSWRATFYASSVSILVILIHATQIWIVCHRFSSCCWKNFLRWAGHHISLMRQSPSRHNLYPHACQEVSSSHKGQSPQVLELCLSLLPMLPRLAESPRIPKNAWITFTAGRRQLISLQFVSRYSLNSFSCS